MLVSLVIAVLNEEHTIPVLWQRIEHVVRGLPEHCFEVVFVDDGSTDRTPAVISTLPCRGGLCWKLVNLSRNFGHQAALSAGLGYVAGEAVVFLDADLQDPPELIGEFLAKFQQGFDVVYGIRTNRKESPIMRFFFSMFYRLHNLMAENRIPADAGDFGLISRRVAKLILSMPENDRMIRCLRSWVGFRQVGIPYSRPERHVGTSRYIPWRRVEGALDGLFGYSKLPIRFAAALGLAVVLIGFAYLCWVYSGWLFFGGKTVPGWTSLISLGFIVAGANIVVTAIVGEYACRVYFQAKARPLYVVDSVRTGQP
ncbi:MAG: glycosyltransferase family 2 protein [Terrimicrobiaceae bacterium]